MVHLYAYIVIYWDNYRYRAMTPIALRRHFFLRVPGFYLR
jgi:hypothetical protein